MTKIQSETIICEIKDLLSQTLVKTWPKVFTPEIIKQKVNFNVDITKKIEFGDFTTNILMVIRQFVGSDFSSFIDHLSTSGFFTKCYQQGAFLNLTIRPKVRDKYFQQIIQQDDRYPIFSNKKLRYNIEFVSANPTGLLHIGHARNACYGDTMTNIWKIYGIDVEKEYYINDAGNQIKKLALSVLMRYLQLFKKKVDVPEDGYHGQEIVDIAKALKEKYGDRFCQTKYDSNYILDEQDGHLIAQYSMHSMLDIIKKHLHDLGVQMDLWSSETTIYQNNLITKAFEKLSKHIYEKEQAVWLKTTSLGDDKDRVLVKSDKSYTYFAPDIAYHDVKLSRKYDKIFCVWGSDHRSYVDRMSIAIQLLGYPKDIFHVMIMQMVRLTKNGQEFKMSKRTGNSFTLQDLLSLIGHDSARWFLVNQSLNTHLEIDIDKVTKKNNENSLYYVKYAYVRIAKILQKASIEPNNKIDQLVLPMELEMINQLFYLPITIENITKTYEVNKLCLYLYNLAKMFHSYYEQAVINDDKNSVLTAQRLSLIKAVQIVIKSGLKLLGIKVTEEM